MKARVMVALCLAALMLGACSASDPSEASENRAIVDQRIQDSQSACQTDPAPDECLQDPEKTSLDSESVSDSDEIEMPSSAPPEPAGEQESSQEPTEPSSPQATENPTVPAEQTPPPILQRLRTIRRLTRAVLNPSLNRSRIIHLHRNRSRKQNRTTKLQSQSLRHSMYRSGLTSLFPMVSKLVWNMMPVPQIAGTHP